MRRFHSYGSIDTEEHYYAPRKELIEKTYTQLIGYNPQKSGHYFTVWAPRQTGKTWIMQQILFRLKKDPRFHVLKINLEILKDQEKVSDIIRIIARKIGEGVNKDFNGVKNQDKFQEIFKKGVLDKPLILILDEFDAIKEKGINAVVSAFRNIYFHRVDEGNQPTDQKTYLLHGVALIGVRSVLGIENQEGSPFNVQRSIHIPNIIKRYQAHLKKNHDIYFKNVPRRKDDLKIYEAIYHFNLYRYLYDLLRARGVEVIPHFPTGNGKVDLLLKYREKIYALELKSFRDMYRFEKAIDQAAEYGRQIGLKEVFLLVFVELSEEEAKQLEKEVDKNGVKVIVLPIGIL